MWETWIGGHIRRANRNLLVTNILVAILVAGIFLLNTRYLSNVFQGPNKLSPQALTAIKDPGSVWRNYVSVQGDKTIDTGVTEVEQTKSKYSERVTSERTTAHYLLLRVANRGLLIKSPNETPATSFTGSLTGFPSEIREKLVAGHEDVFLPFMLDGDDYKGAAYGLLFVGCPILGLAVWNVFRARSRMGDIAAHPLAKTISGYGPFETMLHTMEQEYQGARRQIGDVVFTTSWMLKPATYGANLSYLGDVVWGYKKVTQHRTNFVPTGKTFAIVIRERNGKTTELQANEQQCDEILHQLNYQLPWMLLGYDKELENQWNKSRTSIVETVDQRRAQVMQAHAAQQAQAAQAAQAPQPDPAAQAAQPPQWDPAAQAAQQPQADPAAQGYQPPPPDSPGGYTPGGGTQIT